ncbi:MAG: 3-deoxy-manno-octulosonate cytidylyltransferase [Spirosomataceae bacterium]
MKIIAIIPARLASSRFPEKILVDIEGKSMIQRVYEQVSLVQGIHQILIATDHPKVLEHISSFGALGVLTDPDLPSGTDRCAEALAKMGGEFDYVINVQGDEPCIHPEVLEDLIKVLDYKTEIATLMNPIDQLNELLDPNVVKVVSTMRKQALYFSRQAIPFQRDYPIENWLDHAKYYRHVGVYAFRTDILEQVVKIPVSQLENLEKLEQLRWLGFGYKINLVETELRSIGVDHPDDLEKVKAYLRGE